MRRALVPLLLLAACSSEPVPPADDPCECGPRICGFLCTRACGVCPDDGVCAPDGLSCTPSREVGAPCLSDVQCGTGRICLTAGGAAPNGYCSRRCSDSDPCPGGAVCTLGPEGENTCHAACDPAGGAPTCRLGEGYRCAAAGYCPACVPQCDGRSCGDDGCGGSCGGCLASGVVCDAGRCLDVYTQRLPMPNPAWELAALDDDGLVTLVGGREVVRYPGMHTESRGLKRVTRWNPADGKFTALVDLPEPVARPNAAVLGGLVYVAGGTSDPDTQGAPDAPLASFYVQANTGWRKLVTAGVPEPSTGGCAAATKDKLFLLPGESASGLSKASWAYDPARDRWFPGPARPTARTLAAAASDGERVYVVGGWDGARALGTVEILEPSGNWTTSAPLPESVTGAFATVADGRLFVFGGRNGPIGDLVAYVQVVDLTTRRTTVLGTTFNGLVGQAPVTTRAGTFLFGAAEFSNGVPIPHDEVVQFRVPAR